MDLMRHLTLGASIYLMVVLMLRARFPQLQVQPDPLPRRLPALSREEAAARLRSWFGQFVTFEYNGLSLLLPPAGVQVPRATGSHLTRIVWGDTYVGIYAVPRRRPLFTRWPQLTWDGAYIARCIFNPGWNLVYLLMAALRLRGCQRVLQIELGSFRGYASSGAWQGRMYWNFDLWDEHSCCSLFFNGTSSSPMRSDLVEVVVGSLSHAG
ncbi:MAG: hypothetical protein ACYCW6_17490 [Candidatus Xenobia bacterium]